MAIPLPAVLIGGAIGLFLVGAGLREAVRAVGLRRGGALPIRELEDGRTGTVVVSGRAYEADGTVTAPFTGRECLAVAWRMTGLRQFSPFDADIRHREHELARGSDGRPFFVEDETGSVLVDPEGASFRLAEEWVADPVSDPVEQTDVLSWAGPLAGDPIHRRYVEGRVDEGEQVVVRGRVAGTTDEGAPRLNVRTVAAKIGGQGTYVLDASREEGVRRSAAAAAFSIVLGLVVLGAVGVLWAVL